MNFFVFYLEEGIRHILDLNGYDHILFVGALCALYSLRDWKPLLVLITAFTLGHSLTLALATLNVVYVQSYWVELLIPVTIVITAVSNLFYEFSNSISNRSSYILRYTIALIFGLIHGLGFSNFLRSMLSAEDNLFFPLLAFNLGLEMGQLVVVSLLLLIAFLLNNRSSNLFKYWRLGLSFSASFVALKLILERL